MSPPPTSIDGTDITGATIDGQQVQEITVDGQTVFTAGPDPGIIDNFEDQPDGVYGTNDTVADYYSGDTVQFGRTTSDVIEGSQALEDTGASSNVSAMASVPGDGLNAYPQEGDTIQWLVYTGGSTAGPMVATNTDIDGYLYATSSGANQLQIWRFDNSSFTKLVATNVTISSNKHYLAEGRVPSANDDLLTWDLYNVDTNTLAKGSLIADVAARDSNHVSRGIGWGIVGISGGTFADNLRVL